MHNVITVPLFARALFCDATIFRKGTIPYRELQAILKSDFNHKKRRVKNDYKRRNCKKTSLVVD